MKYRWMFAFVMVAPLACAYLPHDGEQLSAGDTTEFTGFATEPSGQVRIQAQQPGNGEWATIATVTADREPYASSCPTFDQDVYQWSKRITVPSSYFSRDRVTLRAQQQVGSSWFDMWMYDQAGWECLVTRYLLAASTCGELNVWNVGIECSNDRHQITLHR